MQKTMREWFFMRTGFERFRLVPEQNSRYLFGEDDRRNRDLLLASLEEACYSRDGYKATLYGDYGRGKTHQCHNLIHEVKSRDIRVVPVYIKCRAFRKKEPFSSLFGEIVGRHSIQQLQHVAAEYLKKVQEGATGLGDVVSSEDIVQVMMNGLTAPNLQVVRTSLRWLGGEAKVNMQAVAAGLKAQLTDSGDFGDVMRGLSHMLIEVENRVPLVHHRRS